MVSAQIHLNKRIESELATLERIMANFTKLKDMKERTNSSKTHRLCTPLTREWCLLVSTPSHLLSRWTQVGQEPITTNHQRLSPEPSMSWKLHVKSRVKKKAIFSTKLNSLSMNSQRTLSLRWNQFMPTLFNAAASKRVLAILRCTSTRMPILMERLLLLGANSITLDASQIVMLWLLSCTTSWP